jgi:hypothetical protein
MTIFLIILAVVVIGVFVALSWPDRDMCRKKGEEDVWLHDFKEIGRDEKEIIEKCRRCPKEMKFPTGDDMLYLRYHYHLNGTMERFVGQEDPITWNPSPDGERILYVAYKNEYDRDWKPVGRRSSTYQSTYLPLVKIALQRGHIVIPFWADEVVLEKGPRGMNEALRDAIIAEKPDVCLIENVVEGSFDKKILAEITAITA